MPYLKKTVIITGYRCNNHCRFCINDGKRDFPGKTTQAIISEMVYAHKRGRSYLEIIGGEQTIRYDIIYVIRMAKKIGFKNIVVATNGRMLSYKGYAEKLVKAGVTDIIFSIHGHRMELHDYLTRVEGSFKQLLQGIKNIKALGFKNIGSNTTIVKDNFKYLPEVGDFIYNLGIRNSEFIFIDPSPDVIKNNFYEFVPMISEAEFYIKKCLDIGKKNGVMHWHIRYVPICCFVDYEDQISELYENRVFHTEHLAPDFENFDVAYSRKQVGKIKPEKCARCKKYDVCEGVWTEYYKNYGDGELEPIEFLEKHA